MIWIIPNKNTTTANNNNNNITLRHGPPNNITTQSIWDSSIPKYATSYYSNNSGINALIQYANSNTNTNRSFRISKI